MMKEEVIRKIVKMIENKEIVEIKIADNDYCPLDCTNGGKYRYWTKYELTENDNYIVSYHSSSDFFYCPKLAMYLDCIACGYWNKETKDCRKDYEKATIEEVIEHVKEALIDERYDVELITIDNEKIVFHGLHPCKLCNEKRNCSLWID